MFDKGAKESWPPSVLKEPLASAHRRKQGAGNIFSLNGKTVFLEREKPAKLFIPIEKKLESALPELGGSCGTQSYAGRSAHRRITRNGELGLHYVSQSCGDHIVSGVIAVRKAPGSCPAHRNGEIRVVSRHARTRH